MVDRLRGMALSTVENTSYLSTELNALADEGVVTGAAINNSSNRYRWLQVWIDLAAVDLSAEASPSVRVRLIEALGSSSTSFEDNDDKAYGVSLSLDPGTASATHARALWLQVPPGYFQLAFVNETGAAFAATGNTAGYTFDTDEFYTVT